MFGRRNVSRDIWRAVVVAGAMLGTSCSGPAKQVETEPTAVQPEVGGGIAPVEKEPNGTVPNQAAAGEPAVEPPRPPPAVADAGLPDAAPAPPDAAPAAKPKPRPRGTGKKPSGRGFIIA